MFQHFAMPEVTSAFPTLMGQLDKNIKEFEGAQ